MTQRYARAPRAVGSVPGNTRGNITLVFGLGAKKVIAHRSSAVVEAIERHGARIELLPPYSPDLTPVENCGSKVKTALKKAAARSWDALVDAVAVAIRSVTPDDINGWLRHAGFRPKPG
jgi:transposase